MLVHNSVFALLNIEHFYYNYISQMGHKLIVAGIYCKLAKKVACEYSGGSNTECVRISNGQLGSDFEWR